MGFIFREYSGLEIKLKGIKFNVCTIYQRKWYNPLRWLLASKGVRKMEILDEFKDYTAKDWGGGI